MLSWDEFNVDETASPAVVNNALAAEIAADHSAAQIAAAARQEVELQAQPVLAPKLEKPATMRVAATREEMRVEVAFTAPANPIAAALEAVASLDASAGVKELATAAERVCVPPPPLVALLAPLFLRLTLD